MSGALTNPVTPSSSLRQLRQRIANSTAAYIEQISPDELNQPLTLRSEDGAQHSEVYTPAFILLHVCTHAFHHKGQAVAICRLLGAPAPDTDIQRTARLGDYFTSISTASPWPEPEQMQGSDAQPATALSFSLPQRTQRTLRGKLRCRLRPSQDVEQDPLSGKVIGAAIAVHSALGPGLLESTYLQCLCCELSYNHISFNRELPLPVVYRDIKLDCGYRIDLLVENKLIVELKSVDKILSIHKAQLLTYMKLAKISTGLLINFNAYRLSEGLTRMVL